MPKGVFVRTERHLKIIKDSHNTPGYKKKISQLLMGHTVSEETRRKISLANKGTPPPNKGKTYFELYGDRAEEHIERNRRNNKYYQNLPEVKKKKSIDHTKYHYSRETLEDLYVMQQLSLKEVADLLGATVASVWGRLKRYEIPRRTRSEALKGRKITWGDKIGAAHKGKVVSKATKQLQSEAMLKRLENPEYRKMLYLRLQKRPNKSEIRLQALIDIACPDEYKYTGDGSFSIDYRYFPDFTNCNGQKKVIEFYGDYWHRNDNPQDRIDKFAEYGFETLIIWESEMKNPDEVIDRIKEFNKISVEKVVYSTLSSTLLI